MTFHKEIKGDELYLYYNGKLIFKRWLKAGYSKVFDVMAYSEYTLLSIKEGTDENDNIITQHEIFVFKVRERYQLSIGLVITAGTGECLHRVVPGDTLKLVCPDGTIINTKVYGITLNNRGDIILPEPLHKDQIPEGTDVWLVRQK